MFNLFKSKEKKQQEALLRQIEEENRQKEKEIAAKINIKKTLTSMKKQSSRFEKFKEEYIEKARKATLVGDNQTYNLAKSGLKMCLSKQKVIDTMIANFEISMQLNDMNKVIGDFVGGVNIISMQMKSITPNLDMVKAQTAYENAMANTGGQYQALDAFLESASESISEFDGSSSNISDAEIDELICNVSADAEDDIDQEIDKKINDIQAKLKA